MHLAGVHTLRPALDQPAAASRKPASGHWQSTQLPDIPKLAGELLRRMATVTTCAAAAAPRG